MQPKQNFNPVVPIKGSLEILANSDMAKVLYPSGPGHDENRASVAPPSTGIMPDCSKDDKRCKVSFMQHSDKEGHTTDSFYPPDPDEQYFELHPEMLSRVRTASPGEWPEGNELLTTPPYTLVIAIGPRRFLKLGAWRSNANSENTVLQLNQGRLPISDYLERMARRP